MKKTKCIAVITNDDNAIVSHLLFSLFKNNGFKVGLMKNNFIRVNDDLKKITYDDYEYVENLLTNDMDLDYIIFDNLDKKFLYNLTKKFEIEALIDDKIIENEKTDRQIIETKKIMFNNLKRNGISIINSDNKELNSYFNTLKDKIIITYGLNTKSTITASSLDINENISFNCCIQRGITTLSGNEIEQMEFPIKAKPYNTFNISDFLAVIALVLVFEVPIKKIQQIIGNFNGDSCSLGYL